MPKKGEHLSPEHRAAIARGRARAAHRRNGSAPTGISAEASRELAASRKVATILNALPHDTREAVVEFVNRHYR